MKKALIIGGGFAGCTAANILKNKGFDITLFEGNNYLGGGCTTFFYHGHPYTYGPRHLLINIDDTYVWDYFSQYLSLRELKHHTMTYVSDDNRFYTYPIHYDEIKEMPDKDLIYRELDNRESADKAKDFEEYWVNSVGSILYNKFIHLYSEKMWKIKNNKEIDDFAFSPKGVALKTGSKQCLEGQKIIAYPREYDGYNSYFDKCTQGCKVIFNTYIKHFDLNNKRVFADGQWFKGDIIVNTTSLDLVFEYQYGELKYIGRDFLKLILPVERITPEPYYFIQYAGDESYTRVVEYKLLTGYKSQDTLIIIEFPSNNNKLYPYPIKSEIKKANNYKKLFPADTYTIGRAGTYHYDNMDMIVKDCINLFKNI